MQIKTTIIIIILITQNLIGNAQNEFNLNGIIYDATTNLPLEGVLINNSINKYNAITNKNGQFSIIIKNSHTKNDSLTISAIGFKSKNISILEYKSDSIKLYKEEYTLPEVTVQSFFNWDNFVNKIKFKSADLPFESDFQKSTIIIKNHNDPKEFIIKGYAHNEGLTSKGMKSYLKGRTLWYGAFFNNYNDTISFIDIQGSNTPITFTEFERGLFYWFIALPNSEFPIAACKISSLTSLDGDSVFVIEYKPKKIESKTLINKLNRSITGVGGLDLFSLEKTLYVRIKDLKLIKIDFKQKSDFILNNKNIKKFIEISGSVKFEYFDDMPHPLVLNQKYVYEDVNETIIERIDNTYFSNIKIIKLNNSDLKRKYQIKKIYRNFPIRDVSMNHIDKMGPFYNVPIIK